MLAAMREMSVAEQRYQAVLDVISEGRTVKDVAGQWGVDRRTVHRWLARYEAAGLEGLPDRSHRPEQCPHQMPAEIEVVVLELRRAHRYWGARRLVLELVRKKVTPVPSESAVYRCLVRAGVIDPVKRHRRKEMWKRWERGGPMELWQMDVVGGFLLADGTSAKALTGIDDHSRFCVSARLMPREGTQLVCDGFVAALRAHGVPQQVLTDNGKGVHRQIREAARRCPLRPPLSRERDRPPAHAAGVAHHDRQDRALPPHAAGRVRHPARLHQPAGGPAGA